MTVEERIGAADRRRMDGNALFKEEKLDEAMQQYEMVIPGCYSHIVVETVSFLLHCKFQSVNPFLSPALGHSIHGR